MLEYMQTPVVKPEACLKQQRVQMNVSSSTHAKITHALGFMSKPKIG